MTNEERKQYDYEIDRIAQLEYARKEGREEERIKNAKAMKAKGIAVADIAEITGMQIDEVESM